MKQWLSPAHINRLAADPSQCMQADCAPKVDMRLPFVPEDYTQLYYTPVYHALHREHRLRYNQLFGLRINEYIMMLEADLVERLLTPLRKLPAVAGDTALLTAIDTMIGEERRHYTAFAALNRACRPDIYAGGDRRFSHLPLWTRAMFWGAGLVASRLAFSLWYLMAMEESSMALARDMQRRPQTETLGPLDEGFASVHLEHLKDETRHLHIDGMLIDLCVTPVSPARRAFNAKLFRAMLGGVTTPTRGGSGVRVIRQLVRDMPELGWMEANMIHAVLALKDNKAFQQSLFNRGIMPVTFGVFDATEELSGLGERMAGYDRR